MLRRERDKSIYFIKDWLKKENKGKVEHSMRLVWFDEFGLSELLELEYAIHYADVFRRTHETASTKGTYTNYVVEPIQFELSPKNITVCCSQGAETSKRNE